MKVQWIEFIHFNPLFLEQNGKNNKPQVRISIATFTLDFWDVQIKNKEMRNICKDA